MRLAEVVEEPLPDPFQAEVVIVQSQGMSRWLSMRLAAALGVCANVKFPFPASFVWEVFRAVLGDIPTRPTFEPAVTTWHLTHLLGALPAQLPPDPAFDPLRAYLGDDDDRRRWELAGRIADVFDQYLVYRPDWVRKWERDEDADWQAQLWRQLVARVGAPHRVDLWDAFGKRLPELNDWPAALPSRLALFGIPSMPPLYLDVFAKLAERIDVHCFVLNPCHVSWSYLVRERDRPRLARGTGDVAAQHLDTGNRLLASLGRQGREFLDQLQEYNPHWIDQFEPPPGDTRLAALQRDIYELHDRPRGHAPLASDDDRSIQVHVCHSPMREIEVLHDQLLALFNAHEDLHPGDVVVMTPDIEAYAPAIDAVFGTAPPARHIPYTVADRRLQHESPLIEAFMELLALPRSRYEASRVLGLLGAAAVRRRAGFTEADVIRLRSWVRGAGVRWGVDAASRADAGVPDSVEHTWRFGLDRLLLGMALSGGADRQCEGVVPLDDVDGSEAVLLGRFHTFVDAVAGLRVRLSAPRPPAEWCAALRVLLDAFVAIDPDDERDDQTLRAAIAQLESTTTAANFAEPLSLELVTAHLRRTFDVPGGAARFLAGGVTFCALVPMRSITFEVVALIGMNDGSIPRSSRPVSFDRMADDHRRGDRSRRDDDRFLFLEALCSARRCLYVSYVGRDIHDNTERPPSLLVSELLDYVRDGFGADVVIEHPLQPFSRRYFDGTNPRLANHSPELCAASGVARGQEASPPFVGRSLPAAPDEWRIVPLSRLVDFFTHPSRFFVRERLGVRLDDADTRVDSREPFVLDGLGRWSLHQALLALQQRDMPADDALALLRGQGLLPHGTVGRVVADSAWDEVDDFARRLDALRSQAPHPPQPLSFDVAGVRIAGVLDGLTADGRIAHRLGRTRASDRLALWVCHLVLQLASPPGVLRQTRWLSRDESLILSPVEDAADRLAELVRLYLGGLERPLPLLPKSSWAYVTSKRPLGAARDAWEGNEFVDGEGDDPYHALAWRGRDPLDEEFAHVSAAVFAPLRGHTEKA